MEIPLTIKDTQKALLEKKFSCVELVDAYLERIKKFDPKINSFLTITDKFAYQEAKRMDLVLRDLGDEAFKAKPLLGTIVAYKDLFLTKGIRTTAASKVLNDYIPPYSATVVKRLEDAGAICLGKLNCDAWAHGSSGENSDFGPTRNPWNLKYVPGGSSSGSGAALAANFCLLTTGTDTCGSIRLPANYCGVYGLKPTYGAVSRYGIVAMASSLDSIGHFARSIDDIKRVFKVIKGKDFKDATLKQFPEKRKFKKKLKLGLAKEFFAKGIDKQVEKNVLKAIQLLKKQGIKVMEISLPLTQYAIAVYYIIQPAEVSSNLARYDGIRFANDRTFFGAEAKRRIMLGTYVLSAGYYKAYYLKAMQVRSLIIKEVAEAFKKVDAIVAPVAPTPAFKLGEKVDDPLKMYLTDIYAATANLAGLPALAIPYGFTKTGLPLGFQVMGPRFGEETLFRIATLFEEISCYQPKTAKL